MASHLPRGGRKGYVEFVFPDGWTVFLTSANGAADFDYRNIPIFNVTLGKYYGDEYEMDLARARRLKDLADELNQCRVSRKPVVLHCNHGRSRSVICLGAYLMFRCGNSADGAVEALKAAFVAATTEGGAHFEALGLRVEPALKALEILRPGL